MLNILNYFIFFLFVTQLSVELDVKKTYNVYIHLPLVEVNVLSEIKTNDQLLKNEIAVFENEVRLNFQSVLASSFSKYFQTEEMGNSHLTFDDARMKGILSDSLISDEMLEHKFKSIIKEEPFEGSGVLEEHRLILLSAIKAGYKTEKDRMNEKIQTFLKLFIAFGGVGNANSASKETIRNSYFLFLLDTKDNKLIWAGHETFDGNLANKTQVRKNLRKFLKRNFPNLKRSK